MFDLRVSTVLMLACVGVIEAGTPNRPAGASTQPARAPRNDKQVQRDLRRIRELLEGEDVLAAVALREKVADAGTKPPAITKQLAEIDGQIKELQDAQSVKRGKGYLWARRPTAESGAWNNALARARRHARNNKGLRVAVLRIRIEEPDRDEHFGVTARDVNLYRTVDDGYTRREDVRTGDFILAGSDSANHGEIEIQALNHACPKLTIDLPETGVAVAGEILIRASASRDMGRLQVHIVLEPGLSMEDAVLHVGRGFAPFKGGVAIDPDGTCTLPEMAAGPCEVCVDGGKQFRSLRQQTVIKRGELTKLELKAYARRLVTIDWKYRLPAGQGEWEQGMSTVLTGDWAPLDTWGQNGSVYSLSDWDGKSAEIRGVNGRLLPAEAADFDAPRIRATSNDWRTSKAVQSHRLAVGKVFAAQYGRAGGPKGEALIRVRSLESVASPASQPATASE